jgi:hypothetical protein
MFVMNSQQTDIIILSYDSLFLTKVAGVLANVLLVYVSIYCLPASAVQFIAYQTALYIAIQQVIFTERF